MLLGDAMVLLSAVYITEKFGCTKDFCDRHGLRFKAMQEIRKLRRQLTNELTRTANLQIVLDPNSETPGIYFDFRFFFFLIYTMYENLFFFKSKSSSFFKE